MDWYPWYPELYRADTLHLTLAEDGAYRRLIDHYMQSRQPIPDNDKALARVCGASEQEWNGMSVTIRAFFSPQDGKLAHKRCDLELAEQDSRTATKSALGKRGASARHGVRLAHGMPTASPRHAHGMPTASPRLSASLPQTLQTLQTETPLSPPLEMGGVERDRASRKSNGREYLGSPPEPVADKHARWARMIMSRKRYGDWPMLSDSAAVAMISAQLITADDWQAWKSTFGTTG